MNFSCIVWISSGTKSRWVNTTTPSPQKLRKSTWLFFLTGLHNQPNFVPLFRQRRFFIFFFPQRDHPPAVQLQCFQRLRLRIDPDPFPCQLRSTRSHSTSVLPNSNPTNWNWGEKNVKMRQTFFSFNSLRYIGNRDWLGKHYCLPRDVVNHFEGGKSPSQNI